MKKLQSIVQNNSLSTLAILGFLITWEIGVDVTHVQKWFLPSPTAIGIALWVSRVLLLQHTIVTAFEAILGLSIATLIGFLLGCALEYSRLFKKMVLPFIIISQTIPFLVLAPLLVIWFGYGLTSKILVISLVCFYPVTISVIDGFNMIDRDLLRLLDSLGATKKQVFQFVKFPAVLPSFFSGLKIAGTYSIIGAVISEWIGADKGLGIFLVRSSKSYLTDRVFAIMFVIAILSLALISTTELIRRVSIPWFYQKTGGICVK